MTVLFSPDAEADLAALVEYLEERNPRAAEELSERIFAVVQKLAERAFEGPEQSLTTGESVRSWPLPPVRIYYQRQPDALWIVRIHHHARHPFPGDLARAGRVMTTQAADNAAAPRE